METKRALGALSALSQESRLAIYRLLVSIGPEGLLAGEIAEQLEVVPATLSFHLKTLTVAGLIGCERQGRSLRYRANFEQMNALVGFLTDQCCGGNPAACWPAKLQKQASSTRNRRPI
jgi:DNA-binding transcriptional ArsR family regulator